MNLRTVGRLRQHELGNHLGVERKLRERGINVFGRAACGQHQPGAERALRVAAENRDTPDASAAGYVSIVCPWSTVP